MKQIIRLVSVSLVFAACSSHLFSQTTEEIENELVQHLKNIDRWTMITDRTGEDLSDALVKERGIFQTKLLKYARLETTLNSAFAELGKHMYISTSLDRRFRIYSWDTRTGGTMRFFSNVFQYVGSDDRVYSYANPTEGDPGGYYIQIFQLRTKKRTVYMATSQSILSTSYSGQQLKLFEVREKSLVEKVDLIKTRSGLTGSLGFSYDFFSVADRTARPINLFQYNKESKTISFPVVIENEKFPQGEVTNRRIRYRFDGRYFVRIGQ